MHHMQTKKHKRVWDDADKICQRVADGESITSLAIEYNCNRGFLGRVRRTALADKYEDLRYEKYSDDEIKWMLDLRKDGQSIEFIAEKLDRTPCSIRRRLTKSYERPVVAKDLKRTSIKGIINDQGVLDGKAKFAINHLRNEPYAIIPMAEYIRLTSNTTAKPD